MQVGELVNVAVAQIAKEECPFQAKMSNEDPSEEEEDLIDDDVNKDQANSGGKLGTNLKNGTAGTKGTFNDIPQRAPKYKSKREDSSTDATLLVDVLEDKSSQRFTVAAHHLVPGNASLKRSQVSKLMKKGGKLAAKNGDTWTIRTHIGYNVNGSHNGVWLPGHYAIKGWRAGKSDAWKASYIAGAVACKDRQFHDTHTAYNTAVRNLLDKIAAAYFTHLSNCDECAAQAKQEIEPPYNLKLRLYAMSSTLLQMVSGQPSTWQPPYFTSDRYRSHILNDPEMKQVFDYHYRNEPVPTKKRRTS